VNQPKRPRDPNQIAKSIIDIATGQKPGRDPTPEDHGKDPAAVERGKKGGKARADSLTAQKRSEIAKAAARTRWRSRQDQENQDSLSIPKAISRSAIPPRFRPAQTTTGSKPRVGMTRGLPRFGVAR
jgi:hypothetical protein